VQGMPEPRSKLSSVRDDLVETWSTAVSRRPPRTPDALLVRRGIAPQAEPAARRAIEIIVDSAILRTLAWLDGGEQGDDYLYSFLDSRPEWQVGMDPYIEVLSPPIRSLISTASAEMMRLTTARALQLVPEGFRAIYEYQAAIAILERRDGRPAERRAVLRAVESVQSTLLFPGTPTDWQAIDLSEAFCLALDDDPTFALTKSSFRLVASGLVTEMAVEKCIFDGLGGDEV